jgi:hypothetical protein
MIQVSITIQFFRADFLICPASEAPSSIRIKVPTAYVTTAYIVHSGHMVALFFNPIYKRDPK